MSKILRMPINSGFNKIPPNYLFKMIGQRIAAFAEKNPDVKIIRLGIGDAVLGITQKIGNSGKDAIDAAVEKNPGYPSGEGDEDVRSAIKAVYNENHPFVTPDNIVLSHGAKEDSSNIQELFSLGVPVYTPDPVYPVYVNSNFLAGRDDIRLLPATENCLFMPEVPNLKEPSIIYLCFPNNPTGEVATYSYLEEWVKAAAQSGSIIIYDTAYCDFIREKTVPKSIYDINGAEEVAIEIGSFSKSAGFTGIRTAWTTIPPGVKGVDKEGKEYPFIDFWIRRQNYKMNGVPVMQQKMAYTALTEARAETLVQVDYYLTNAEMIKNTFKSIGLTCYGGVNSPYVWAKTPNGMESWDFFDLLLNKCGVVCTPGAGFGDCGEGFFRLSAFGIKEEIAEALDRIEKLNF